MAFWISLFFGVTSFCLIVAVSLKTRKPVPAQPPAPAIRDNVVEFRTASPLMDNDGRFVPISRTCELKFPKVPFRRENPGSLRLGAPLNQAVRTVAYPAARRVQ